MSTFADWQPAYAEHNIPTFPVLGGVKKPAVTGYLRMGLPASRALVARFGHVDAFGFALKRADITVLDVDTPDERVLADALTRHGPTPIIVRTQSGNWQGWYRNGGEGRSVRPFPSLPIDVLGKGYVVAPPSNGAKGVYGFVEGSLDDLVNLPLMRGAPGNENRPGRATGHLVEQGQRNDQLFEYYMREAHGCDRNQLLAKAMRFNESCVPPLPADIVAKTVASAWGYTERGENRYGQVGAWFPAEEANRLIKSGQQDVFILLAFLRANNGPHREFMIANGLAEEIHLTRKRLSAARAYILQAGHIERVRAPAQGVPALYRWKVQGGRN
jgi:hypothetical protein